MKNYIIEQDSEIIQTAYYAVNANSIDEAIELAKDMEPIAIKDFLGEELISK